ncbi:titin [Echinococcus multilocularis]|uniref:Titin n=1 Tax=Echinococcus multilocularis TaxID=6211 RepID=A0A068Y399_ECHMU|nr:titin [Echinococcus multilocularis]
MTRTMFNSAVIFGYFSLALQAINADLIAHCQEKSVWGPWRCPGSFGRCTDKVATRYKCPEGDCVEGSQCTSLPGFMQTKNCGEALGRGECRPFWSSWTSWSACSATCGVSERSRYRPCSGAYTATSTAEVEESCADPAKAAEGLQKRDCPLQRLCPRIAGGWGEWSAFSACDATCGRGSRRRIRLCNRPPPQGGGVPCQGIDTQEVECDVGVPCAVDGSWCPWSGTVVKCSAACGDSGMGLRTRLCACPSPAHGGKSCSLPPGAKEAAMLALSYLQDAAIRKGTSGGKGDGDDDFPMPTAADIAAIADGSGKWDACNRKFCPYLKRLTDFEVNITIDDLRLQRPEDAWLWSGGIPSSRHDPVGLHCSPQLRSRTKIYDKRYRFPRARAMWTRSVGRSEYQSYDFVGTPLRANRRLQILRDRLIIRSLDEADEGVYRYGYEYEPLQFATICFFAVYLSDKVAVIESGKPFKLTCNAKGLWPIIQQTPKDNWKTFWAYRPDAKAAALGIKPIKELWLVDLKPPCIMEEEDIFMNTTERTMVMTLFDTERRQFDAVAYAMSGYYQCIVQNSPKGLGERNFVTNAVQLIVVSPPTLTEKLKKWIVKHWRAIVYLLLTLMVVTLFYILLIRLRARRVASLRNWEALEEAKKRAKLITAGEIKVKTK